ncbi:MAG: C69 family dipeptidase [bacterium]
MLKNLSLLVSLMSGILFFHLVVSPRTSTTIPSITEYDACTSILVGKAASIDGSTMTSHSCDSRTDRTWITVVPHRTYKSGAMTNIFMGSKETKGPDDTDVLSTGEIPQVAETYAYINSAYPVMNEHQLAIGETTFGGKSELKSDEGIFDCPELYRIALERAKTAREAIQIIDHLTKQYGYNDFGECFTFADPNETWHFEILGPGRGKLGAVWAAVRIPDDHVGVSANASRIRQLNPKEPDWYMASSNVFSLAEEQGWWNSKSEQPFEFCYVYADRNSMGSRRREWRVLSKAAPSLKLDPNAENYPLSVKAEKQLSVNGVLSMFRDYYQNTDYDMTNGLFSKDKEGKAVKNPVANPFMNVEYKELFRIKSERTIACNRATYVHVTQSRSWLPNPIGGVVWLGYDNPVTTPHTPFYCGIESMPKSYMVDGRREYSTNCAWWTFRTVSQLCYFRYQEMVQDVDTVRKDIEEKAFTNQPGFEKEVVEVYKRNPSEARKMLTAYSHKIANDAIARYSQLHNQLWLKYTYKF